MLLMFGNKKKKIELMNEQSKKDIQSKLETLIQHTNDPSVAAKLNSVTRILIEQGSSSEDSVFALDKLIKNLIDDLSKDILAGKATVVLAKLDKVLDNVTLRSTYCNQTSQHLIAADARKQRRAEKLLKKTLKNTSVDEQALYTPEELLELMLAEAAEKKARLEDEQKTTHDLIVKNNRDAIALSNWEVLKIKIKEIDESIAMLSDARKRDVLATAFNRLTVEQKQLIASRQISDEQFNVLMSDFKKIKEVNAEQNAYIQQAEQLLFDSSAAVVTDANEAINNANQFDNMRINAVLSDPVFVEMGNNAQDVEKNEALNDCYDEIDSIILALRKCELMYTNKLEDVNETLKEQDLQLKMLLQQRNNASASECLVMDGEIDRLNASRVNMKNIIKKYRQALAINTEKMALANSVKNQAEIDKINKSMNEFAQGAFENYEEIALSLRGYIEAANEELDKIGAVNAVADSAVVSMNTISGNDIENTYEAEIKDEEKYKALEEELGIRKAGV